MVLEIPPADGGSITGTIMDRWQTPLEDVGPAGVDKGKGGKYLILPPGYTGTVPMATSRCRRQTYQGYALLRSILQSGSDADVAKAVAYGKRIKLYPLPPRRTRRRRPSSTPSTSSSTPPSPTTCASSSRSTAWSQSEPWLERDRAMIDPLRSIGIEKGKPFNPDATTQDILNDAAQEARQWLDAAVRSESFCRRSTTAATGRCPGTRTDGRACRRLRRPEPLSRRRPRSRRISYGVLQPKHLGLGRSYLMTIEGQGGPRLRRRQHLSPAVSGARAGADSTGRRRSTTAPPTRSIRDMTRASRSSQSPGLQKNADGSVDIYFGPAGARRQGIELGADEPRRRVRSALPLLRPREVAVRQEAWRLPDIEKNEPS